MSIKIIKKPKPLKAKAIKDPHHFTVKVTRARKVELKLMAVRRRATVLAMFSSALHEFLANPPSAMPHIPAPEQPDRFVFKVEPGLAANVQSLGKALGVPAQTIISAALDAYLTKHSTE